MEKEEEEGHRRGWLRKHTHTVQLLEKKEGEEGTGRVCVGGGGVEASKYACFDIADVPGSLGRYHQGAPPPRDPCSKTPPRSGQKQTSNNIITKKASAAAGSATSTSSNDGTM